MKTVFKIFGLGAIAWGAYKLYENRGPLLSTSTIPDQLGNYDIDGVSFDPAGRNVVVSGDSNVAGPRESVREAQRLADLHSA